MCLEPNQIFRNCLVILPNQDGKPIKDSISEQGIHFVPR
jgi:hypothetical protein